MKKEIICPRDNETDLSLIEYSEIEEGCFEALFECRQCNNNFTVFVSEKELNLYK